VCIAHSNGLRTRSRTVGCRTCAEDCEGSQTMPRRRQLAGWVARTRPLAEPLSPRGPQPVMTILEGGRGALNGSGEPFREYSGCSTRRVRTGLQRGAPPDINICIFIYLRSLDRPNATWHSQGKLGESTRAAGQIFTPVRKPPRCPVNATRHTPRASTANR